MPPETRPEVPEDLKKDYEFSTYFLGNYNGGISTLIYLHADRKQLIERIARSETREALLEKALRDAKREGWNDAIDAVCHVVPNSFPTGVIRALSKRSPDGTHD